MKYIVILALLMLGVSFAIMIDAYMASIYSEAQSILFKIKTNPFNLELVKWLFFVVLGCFMLASICYLIEQLKRINKP